MRELLDEPDDRRGRDDQPVLAVRTEGIPPCLDQPRMVAEFRTVLGKEEAARAGKPVDVRQPEPDLAAALAPYRHQVASLARGREASEALEALRGGRIGGTGRRAKPKLLYLILNRSEKEWVMPPREWAMAKAQFAVIFGDRFVRALAA